jgi:hypothetical protein
MYIANGTPTKNKAIRNDIVMIFERDSFAERDVESSTILYLLAIYYTKSSGSPPLALISFVRWPKIKNSIIMVMKIQTGP